MWIFDQDRRQRTRLAPGRGGGPPTDDLPGDGGPDEAASFIAESVAELALLARRHKLGSWCVCWKWRSWKPRSA